MLERQQEIENQTVNPVAEGWKIQLYNTYLQTKGRLANTARWCYNVTAGWIFPTLEYSTTGAVMNPVEIMNILVKVHGHQIFIDGKSPYPIQRRHI